MELIVKQDMVTRTKFPQNISDADFERNRLLVQENDLIPYIGTACLNAIVALDRESVTDQAKELYAFWRDFVLPYMTYAVYGLFIDTHGYTMAPAGFTGMATGGPQNANPLDEQGRQALKRQYERFTSTALTKLQNEFADKNETFDSVTYALDENVRDERPKAGGLTAVGSIVDRIGIYRKIRV
jgi:hypothetical protein